MPEDRTAESVSPFDAWTDDNRTIELRVAAMLENLAVVRTVVGAIAIFEDLTLDAAADLRLAVDEVCTMLIRIAALYSTLTVTVAPGDDAVVITVHTTSVGGDGVQPSTFGWHVLTSLADEVRILEGDADSARPSCGIALLFRRASRSP